MLIFQKFYFYKKHYFFTNKTILEIKKTHIRYIVSIYSYIEKLLNIFKTNLLICKQNYYLKIKLLIIIVFKCIFNKKNINFKKIL